MLIKDHCGYGNKRRWLDSATQSIEEWRKMNSDENGSWSSNAVWFQTVTLRKRHEAELQIVEMKAKDGLSPLAGQQCIMDVLETKPEIFIYLYPHINA